MSNASDDDLDLESGRLLFAQPCDFVRGVTSIELDLDRIDSDDDLDAVLADVYLDMAPVGLVAVGQVALQGAHSVAAEQNHSEARPTLSTAAQVVRRVANLAVDQAPLVAAQVASVVRLVSPSLGLPPTLVA